VNRYYMPMAAAVDSLVKALVGRPQYLPEALQDSAEELQDQVLTDLAFSILAAPRGASWREAEAVELMEEDALHALLNGMDCPAYKISDLIKVFQSDGREGVCRAHFKHTDTHKLVRIIWRAEKAWCFEEGGAAWHFLQERFENHFREEMTWQEALLRAGGGMWAHRERTLLSAAKARELLELGRALPSKGFCLQEDSACSDRNCKSTMLAFPPRILQLLWGELEKGAAEQRSPPGSGVLNVADIVAQVEADRVEVKLHSGKKIDPQDLQRYLLSDTRLDCNALFEMKDFFWELSSEAQKQGVAQKKRSEVEGLVSQMIGTDSQLKSLHSPATTECIFHSKLFHIPLYYESAWDQERPTYERTSSHEALTEYCRTRTSRGSAEINVQANPIALGSSDIGVEVDSSSDPGGRSQPAPAFSSSVSEHASQLGSQMVRVTSAANGTIEDTTKKTKGLFHRTIGSANKRKMHLRDGDHATLARAWMRASGSASEETDEGGRVQKAFNQREAVHGYLFNNFFVVTVSVAFSVGDDSSLAVEDAEKKGPGSREVEQEVIRYMVRTPFSYFNTMEHEEGDLGQCFQIIDEPQDHVSPGARTSAAAQDHDHRRTASQSEEQSSKRYLLQVASGSGSDLNDEEQLSRVRTLGATDLKQEWLDAFAQQPDGTLFLATDLDDCQFEGSI